MPDKIVDFSARSEIIAEEPWHLHFWESKPAEIVAFLRDPRGQLEEMGIRLPEDCRIETKIENHDWIAAATDGLRSDNGPIIICNVGGGNVAKGVYTVAMYGHRDEDVGAYKKELLHDPRQQHVGDRGGKG